LYGAFLFSLLSSLDLTGIARPRDEMAHSTHYSCATSTLSHTLKSNAPTSQVAPPAQAPLYRNDQSRDPRLRRLSPPAAAATSSGAQSPPSPKRGEPLYSVPEDRERGRERERSRERVGNAAPSVAVVTVTSVAIPTITRITRTAAATSATSTLSVSTTATDPAGIPTRGSCGESTERGTVHRAGATGRRPAGGRRLALSRLCALVACRPLTVLSSRRGLRRTNPLPARPRRLPRG
jgi:hypothetical protein